MKRLFIALALVAGVTWLGGGTPASAHTPEVSADCSGITYNLKSYEAPKQGDSFNNFLSIYVDGEMKTEIPFSKSLSGFYPMDGVTDYDWKVVIDANVTKGNPTKWDRTFEGSVDGCTPPSKLGLTYNQDCAPDDTNTWRIRPVDVNQDVAWELRYVGGSTVASGTMQPGDGEDVRDIAPRESVTAKLFWDSDGNGSLDKSTTKAGGSVLTDPALYKPGAKCGPEIPEQPEPKVEIEQVVDCEALAVSITVTTTPYVYDEQTNSWVLGEPEVEWRTRVLNDDEGQNCAPDKVTVVGEWEGSPECGESEYMQFRATTITSYVWNGTGFDEMTAVIDEVRTVQVEEVEPCATVPPTTEPPCVGICGPATVPSTTAPEPPVTTVATSTPPPATPSGELPSTGSNGTNTLTLLALAALGAGGAILFGARRKAPLS